MIHCMRGGAEDILHESVLTSQFSSKIDTHAFSYCVITDSNGCTLTHDMK